MSTEWRDFEELVARIEETLVPKGATVKSPDRIRDLVTGKLREVDASIRFDVGSAPVLITIECRRRKNIQDDTWVEQLATKRAKIGAAKTIAVSATGFTDSAVKTARLNGIELRTLEDRIGEEIVQEFLSGFQISVIVTDYETHTIAFQLQDGSPLGSEDFGDDLRKELAGGGPSAVLATEVRTGRVLTINAILRAAGDADLPEDGTPITKHAVATFEPGAFLVSTKSGPAALGRIEIVAVFTKRVRSAPPASLYEYSSPNGSIRRTLEAIATIGEGDAIRVFADIDSPSLERQEKESVSTHSPNARKRGNR